MSKTDRELDAKLDALLQAPVVFVANGTTYRHREALRSWGWFWDRGRNVWICEGETDATASRVRAISKLPGVTVTRRPTVDEDPKERTEDL